MYRVEWMQRGSKTVFWDGFARLDIAMRFMREKREDETIIMLTVVTPWDTLWF